MKNYYDILGIDEDADKSKIHSAFKNLAKQHHPDRGGDAEKFKEIKARIRYTQKVRES